MVEIYFSDDTAEKKEILTELIEAYPPVFVMIYVFLSALEHEVGHNFRYYKCFGNLNVNLSRLYVQR